MTNLLKIIFAAAIVITLSVLPSKAATFGGSHFLLGRVAQTVKLDPSFQMPQTLSSAFYSETDLQTFCMAVALYHEARGETEDGQKAVAQVILNRAKSKAYPPTACGVIYQNAHRYNRCQFSFACDKISDTPKKHTLFKALKKIAVNAMTKGIDLPALAGDVRRAQITHYHTTSVSPSWGRKIERITTIGAHIFYRSERVAKSL